MNKYQFKIKNYIRNYIKKYFFKSYALNININYIRNYIKKYFFKHYSFNININYIKNNPFLSTISSIIFIFILLLYFTIPAYYNYENFDNEINKKISKDFKLDLKNIKGIKYLILPAPHFLIEECDLYFLNNPEKILLKAKKLKINVYSKNLYKKEKIELKNIVLNKVDLDIEYVDLKNFYNHIKNNITKPIYINNSNLFFKDKNKKIISISKMKNFDYFFDFKKKSKKLNISGNLFGSNFTFNWEKNFLNPYISKSNIKFKNPKINILNKFDRQIPDYIDAQTNINFLKNSIDLNYKFNKEIIEFYNVNNNNFYSSKIKGNINLKPFFFDLDVQLSNIKISTIFNFIFLNLDKTNQISNINFNGNLKIHLDSINNRLFDNLVLKIKFFEEKINLDETTLDIKKIGKINFSNPYIYEKNQRLFIKSKIKFKINNQEEFYKRFQVNKKNRIDLNEIYFEAEYNVDDNNFYLSGINPNKNTDQEVNFYEIKNIQQLSYMISSEFNKLNLE